MQEKHLVALYRAGEHTVSELEELFSVTRSTVYRAVRRAGGRASAAASDAAAAAPFPAGSGIGVRSALAQLDERRSVARRAYRDGPIR